MLRLCYCEQAKYFANQNACVKSITTVMGTSSRHAVYDQSAKNQFDHCDDFLISFSSILLDFCSINYLKLKHDCKREKIMCVKTDISKAKLLLTFF